MISAVTFGFFFCESQNPMMKQLNLTPSYTIKQEQDHNIVT
jgi:hypothetical protein